jgi:hypothetical protein
VNEEYGLLGTDKNVSTKKLRNEEWSLLATNKDVSFKKLGGKRSAKALKGEAEVYYKIADSLLDLKILSYFASTGEDVAFRVVIENTPKDLARAMRDAERGEYDRAEFDSTELWCNCLRRSVMTP